MTQASTSRRGLRLLLIVFLAAWYSAPVLSAEDTVAIRIARIESGLRPALAWRGEPVRRWQLAERMEHHGAPAVSVAVLDEFEIAWARAWGVVRIGGERPATPETLFQAGSISKPVTALVALRLVSEGAQGLDDPVNERLTSWRLPSSPAGGSEPVRLRHLLSHGAGISPFTFPPLEPEEAASGVLPLLRRETKRPPPPVARVAPPGRRFEYANPGYAVVQQLLEDVSGVTLAELALRELFEPLGMSDSSFAARLPAALLDGAAFGHAGETLEPVTGKGVLFPAAVGGLWTTPSDLARLLQEVLLAYRGEEDLRISTPLAREFLSPQVEGQGLGVRRAGEARGRYFLHGGGTVGFVAFFIAFPATGQGAAVMANGPAYGLLGEIVRAVAAEYDWPGYLAEYERLTPTAEELERFTGPYVFDREQAMETVVYQRDGALYRGRTELVPVGRHLFAHPELDDEVEFLVDGEGRAQGFLYGKHGMNRARARRMPPLPKQARLEGGAAYGEVRKRVGPYGNLETNFTASDLEALGIAPGGSFGLRIGGRDLTVRYAEGFADVPNGTWAALVGQHGRVVLALGGGNTMAALASEPGEAMRIVRSRPRRDDGLLQRHQHPAGLSTLQNALDLRVQLF